MKYARWVRVDPTPGWRVIYVLVKDDGELPVNERIQCSTLDRAPFMMKRKDVEARYKPEGKA